MQSKTSATEERRAGLVTADRVLDNVKKKNAQKEKNEDQGGMGRPDSEGHRSENISKSATTAVK